LLIKKIGRREREMKIYYVAKKIDDRYDDEIAVHQQQQFIYIFFVLFSG
jgi:hypothetical protein